ncbi:hypothetical protein ACFVAE_02580 [Microbacterium sp. NPDC057659]|uniref:hypothetical protein n=1 Tax=Microbacterium sp. NPDC057659 TaxID=3346198 RepID=UPI00366E4854
MTENRSPAALVSGVHRGIRVLDPQEGPFQGELVAEGQDVRVRADAADCAGEPFWAFSGAEHVAGALDLVRRADGTDVLLPWCTERLGVFLGRRVTTEQPLGTGESVTLVGSLLRGLVELDGSPLPGTWWLTDGGRPVFALGAGEPAAEATRALVARVRASASDRSLERLLTDIDTGLADPRAARRRMDRWEAELTELAAPRPLQREVFAPAAASAVVEERFPADAGGREASGSGWRSVAAGWFGTVLGGGRALLARVPRLSGRPRGTSASEGTVAPTRAGRRRPLLVGLAAALIVLAGGLLWPSGEVDEPASAQTTEKKAAVLETHPVPSATPSPAVTQDAELADDPVSAASALLKRIRRCVQEHDERCADAVVEGSAAAVLKAVGDTEAGNDVALVDSYGDIAVIRRGGAGEEQQILVLLRQKDEWLVRDVYAVADQPGSS